MRGGDPGNVSVSKYDHMGQIPQDGNFGENVAYFF